jgi:di/tricarboxylate transporter
MDAAATLTMQGGLVLAVVVGTMALFVSQKLRVDLVALCSLAALLGLGLIDHEQALFGFSNPATVTVAAMFVLSAGLVRTGLVGHLGSRLERLAGRSHGQLLLVLCVTIAVLSAFIVNTATVAIFIPIAIALARSRKIQASQVLIPISFASQFGGVCTLIGTSTNILVSSIAVTNGLAAFELFEFAPLGLVMAAVGILYLLLVAPRFLPRRKGEVQAIDKYRLADYLAEFIVGEESPLVGETWRSAASEEAREIDLIKLLRDDDPIWRPAQARLAAGDVLLLHGAADQLMKIKDLLHLETLADATIEDQNVASGSMQLVEVLVPPTSRMAGRPLGAVDFRRRYGGIVLALQRRGRIVRERLERVKLAPGDTLLIQTDEEGLERMLRSRDLIVTHEISDLHVRHDRSWVAVAILLAVVGVAALGVLPIYAAALMGALAMVLTGCLDPEEAYQSVDWKVILLLAGILPMGLALQGSGAAAWLVQVVLGPVVAIGPLAVLAGLYVLTATLTETMSNNAAAVLLAPIALSIAAALQVDPRPFLVAITFAASTSFATPIGYQTNTMIYAPGGYRFADYARVGIPLNLLFWGLAVWLIPLLWPF